MRIYKVLRKLLLVFCSLLSSISLNAQEDPHNQNGGSGDYVVESEGDSHFLQERDRSLVALSEFKKNLPKESEKLLAYIIDTMNSSVSNKTSNTVVYAIEELPKTQIAPEVSYEIDKSNRKIQTKIKVRADLLKNPVYLLEVLTTLNAAVGEYYMLQLYYHHEMVEKYPHSYYHNGHYITDHSKIIENRYHDLVVQSFLRHFGVTPQEFSMSSSYQPMIRMELIENARRGSPYAQLDLKKSQVELLNAGLNYYSQFQLIKDLSESQRIAFLQELAQQRRIDVTSGTTSDQIAALYFSELKSRAAQDLNSTKAMAVAQYRRDREILSNPDIKKLKDRLESAALKLSDLVVRNDRDGVASLLEAYLPFDVMEPIEKQIWYDWVDAIRSPQKSQEILLYRGLDKENDKLQKSATPGKFGMFPTLLNKNQGSFTRRLRSLITMRYKIMAQSGSQAESALNSVPLMTKMMSAHSGDPNGSPVLSFTPSASVASDFASSGIISIRIDQRRALPNIVSSFYNELEILVPLVIFPDEVIHYQALDPENTDNKAALVESFEAETLRIAKEQGVQILKADDATIYNRALDIFGDATTSEGPNQCRHIFK